MGPFIKVSKVLELLVGFLNKMLLSRGLLVRIPSQALYQSNQDSTQDNTIIAIHDIPRLDYNLDSDLFIRISVDQRESFQYLYYNFRFLNKSSRYLYKDTNKVHSICRHLILQYMLDCKEDSTFDSILL